VQIDEPEDQVVAQLLGDVAIEDGRELLVELRHVAAHVAGDLGRRFGGAVGTSKRSSHLAHEHQTLGVVELGGGKRVQRAPARDTLQRWQEARRACPTPPARAQCVWQEHPDGTITFHPLPPPTHDVVAALAVRVVRRAARILARRVADLAGDDEPDALAHAQAEAVQTPLALAEPEPDAPRSQRRRCAFVDGLTGGSTEGRGPCSAYGAWSATRLRSTKSSGVNGPALDQCTAAAISSAHEHPSRDRQVDGRWPMAWRLEPQRRPPGSARPTCQ